MSAALGVLRLPDDVRFGYGVRAGIADAVAALGRRVFVVADPFLATTPEFEDLRNTLIARGLDVRVHTDVPPELPVAVVEASGAVARSFAPDVIVGYGGGSALDAAKLIALLVSHGGELASYYGENAVPGPVVPLVAVPTTAGTGSEVTPVAVVSDPTRELKVGVSSGFLVPRVGIVDPELTVGAPKGVTAHSGIDAFVHAVESYTAASLDIDRAARLPVFVGRNVLTDPLSLEAAGTIFRALPTAVENPSDRAGRESMAYGSLLAGMAFGSAGTHLSHAIQYPIGAMTKTPHGLGTGALLPYVLQACLPAIRPRLSALGVAMGVLEPGEGESDAAAQRVVDAIAGLCARIGLPVALADLGLTSADRDRIVDLTLQVGRLVAISPVAADADFIGRIVDAAIAGDRARISSADLRTE
jgi:alcohol dehydrogenase class IV